MPLRCVACGKSQRSMTTGTDCQFCGAVRSKQASAEPNLTVEQVEKIHGIIEKYSTDVIDFELATDDINAMLFGAVPAPPPVSAEPYHREGCKWKEPLPGGKLRFCGCLEVHRPPVSALRERCEKLIEKWGEIEHFSESSTARSRACAEELAAALKETE